MPRSYRPHSLSYSFGPGPITPAVKWIIWINVAAFVATVICHDLLYVLGSIPAAVVERFWIWQPVTYMFMHAGPTHILFNMLGIWMFGVELERLWGTKFFVRYYAVTGIGAAITTIVVAFLPFEATARHLPDGHGRRLAGPLRDPAGVCSLLSRPSDPDGAHLSHSGRNISSSSSARSRTFPRPAASRMRRIWAG